MFTRVPQPPVNPAARALERHEFRPGIYAVLLGFVLLFLGAGLLTSVKTVEGSPAAETQLMKAFSSGGLQFAGQLPLPLPPNLNGVLNPAEAMDRWAKQVASAQNPNWKVRVDASAKTPCPT